MLRVQKPKNARSKRALEKRESKEKENVKTAIFVRGSKVSNKVSIALTQLSLLKKPDSISFSKKNEISPFESTGQQSLEFWSNKNDASLFLVGDDKKKRKDNLTWCRLFDGKLLDLLEMQVLEAKPMTDFKGPKPGLGLRPLFHFSGPQFQTDSTLLDPTLPQTPHQHLKSLLLDFYHGEELPSAPSSIAGEGQIALAGLQHVISVTAAPTSENSNSSKEKDLDLQKLYDEASKFGQDSSSNSNSMIDNSALGQIIHFRVYTTQFLASGNKIPRVELIESGPSFDFSLRRRKPAPLDLLTQAMKRLKTKEEKMGQGKGKLKNLETDEMGDLVGRIHLGKQDLKSIQNRKMKGLKAGKGGESDGDDDDGDDDDDEDDDEEMDGEEDFRGDESDDDEDEALVYAEDEDEEELEMEDVTQDQDVEENDEEDELITEKASKKSKTNNGKSKSKK